MKKIECLIKPERLTELREALLNAGIGGMTISDVRGFGKQNTRPDSYLVLPKIKIELICADEQIEALVDIIITICRKNELGDGKIAIMPVEDYIRIRTGERAQQAVY